MMENIIKNLFLMIISVMLILCFVESALYLSSRIYYAYRIKSKVTQLKDKDTIRILCLGDSYTFGMGAHRGYSYPEQLQRLLDKYISGKKFTVYNSGFPGNTSSRLLNRLEEDLQKYEPSILVILIGVNDRFCIEETNYILFKNDGFKNSTYRLDYYLSRLRVYKLFKRGWDDLMMNWWRKKLLAKYGSPGMTESLEFKETKPQNTDKEKLEEFNRHIQLGKIYFNERNTQVSLAIEEFRKAIEIMPDNEESYLSLAQVYSHLSNYYSAIQLLEKVVQINPYNQEVFNKLWLAYYHNGQTTLAQEALQKYLYLNPKYIPTYLAFLKYGFPIIDDFETFGKLLKYNLQKIIDFSRINKITIILQNYPEDKLQESIYKRWASENNISFVDNGSVFKQLELQEDYRFTDYFMEDHHCNNKGYFIMAGNVYKAIKDIIKNN